MRKSCGRELSSRLYLVDSAVYHRIFQPAARLCLWGFLSIEARVRCAECQFIKSKFIKEDMDETVFMFALFKCRKFDKRRN